MTDPAREEAFRRYCQHPPPGSALERAIAFGIDPTITFHLMFAMTPQERLDRADAMICEMQEIHRMRERRCASIPGYRSSPIRLLFRIGLRLGLFPQFGKLFLALANKFVRLSN